jgi:hypothetical protein
MNFVSTISLFGGEQRSSEEEVQNHPEAVHQHREAQLSQAFEDLEAENDELHEELVLLSVDYDTSQLENQNKTNEIQKLVQTIENLSQECDDLRNRLHSQNSKKEKNDGTPCAKHGLAVMELGHKLKNAALERTVLADQIAKVETDNLELEETIASLRRESSVSSHEKAPPTPSASKETNGLVSSLFRSAFSHDGSLSRLIWNDEPEQEPTVSCSQSVLKTYASTPTLYENFQLKKNKERRHESSGVHGFTGNFSHASDTRSTMPRSAFSHEGSLSRVIWNEEPDQEPTVSRDQNVLKTYASTPTLYENFKLTKNKERRHDSSEVHGFTANFSHASVTRSTMPIAKHRVTLNGSEIMNPEKRRYEPLSKNLLREEDDTMGISVCHRRNAICGDHFLLALIQEAT